MQYYKLIFNYETHKEYPLAEPSHDLRNRYIIYDGNEISDWEPVQFECDVQDTSCINENLGNSYRWPILSQNALKLLGDIINEDVQLLPVQVISKESGNEIGKYSVLNILPLIDALDLTNSIYFYHGKNKEHLSVVEYALKKSKVEKNHIFRLKDSAGTVFVSEKFREIARKNKMRSFDFIKVKMK